MDNNLSWALLLKTNNKNEGVGGWENNEGLWGGLWRETERGSLWSAVRGPTQVLRLKEERTGGWLRRERGV